MDKVKFNENKKTEPISEISRPIAQENYETIANEQSDKKKWETLPAIKVDNEVLWVNDKVAMPFDFKKGESVPIGVFLTLNPAKGEPIFHLGVLKKHTRSGLVGQVIFGDSSDPKLLYRDIDLKGSGGVTDRLGMRVEPPSRECVECTGSNMSVFGFLDYKFAVHDKNMSEKLVQKGLRTHRV